jgi:hypothetical protein
MPMLHHLISKNKHIMLLIIVKLISIIIGFTSCIKGFSNSTQGCAYWRVIDRQRRLGTEANNKTRSDGAVQHHNTTKAKNTTQFVTSLDPTQIFTEIERNDRASWAA